MITISVRETFLTAPLHLVSGIGDMLLYEQGGNLMLYTATRSGGGVMACDVDGAITMVDSVALSGHFGLPAEPTLDIVMFTGLPQLVVSGPYQQTLMTYAIEGPGTIGPYTGRIGGPVGAISAHVLMQVGTERFLYVSRTGDGSVLAYRMATNGVMTQFQDLELQSDQQGVALADLVEIRVGSAVFLAGASPGQDMVFLMQVGTGGALTQTDVLGPEQGVGINGTSGLKTLSVHGQTYLLAASGGSSSLTVMEVGSNGRLTLRDHVIDTLSTRLQGVAVVETAVFNGSGIVIAGGGDNGLTIMEMLPDGRLVLLANVLDTLELALEAITALTLRVTATGIDLFVAGEGSGITRLTLDLSAMTGPQLGSGAADVLMGGDGQDFLAGGQGADYLAAAAGNDLLSDGAGSDTLFGGAGQDLFVLTLDGHTDRIGDFQAGIDRIDLSQWGMARSIAGLTYEATANGAVLSFGTERLEITAANGLTLQRAMLAEAGLFDIWHAVSTVNRNGSVYRGSALSEFILGTGEDETFEVTEGNDTVHGGGGADVLDMGSTELAWIVDLAGLYAWTPGILQRVEGVTSVAGGVLADRLSGSDGGNLLQGNAGTDLLFGRGGNDTLAGNDASDVMLGGAGADVLDGGEGIDRVQYTDATQGLTVDLATSTANTGFAAGDVFVSIEDIYGTFYDDNLSGKDIGNVIIGDAGRDRILGRGASDYLAGRWDNDSLYGGDGDDVLQGGHGADVLDGGAGIDRAEYTDAPTDVRVDLLSPHTNTGFAFGDIYASVENLRGSFHNDVLLGDSNANLLAGETGNDALYGRAGADILIGGAGNDSLFGNEDSDVLVGGWGFDLLDGGAGRDRVQYTESINGLRVDLFVPSTNSGMATGDVFVMIEDLLGTYFNDTLLGDAGGNAIAGEAGNDLVYGRTGNDTLSGGSGRDTLHGGDGDDQLLGGAEADEFVFTAGLDAVLDFAPQEDLILLQRPGLWGAGADVALILASAIEEQATNSILLQMAPGHALRIYGIWQVEDLTGHLALI